MKNCTAIVVALALLTLPFSTIGAADAGNSGGAKNSAVTSGLVKADALPITDVKCKASEPRGDVPSSRDLSFSDFISISGWFITLFTGIGSICLSLYFFVLSNKQFIAAQSMQFETNNYVRDSLGKVAHDLDSLREMGSRTEGLLQSVHTQVASRLAERSMDKVTTDLTKTLSNLTASLAHGEDAKQVLVETTKAVENAVESSRKEARAIKAAMRALSDLDRESIATAIAAIKLSAAGQAISVEEVAAMSGLTPAAVSKAMNRLTTYQVAERDGKLEAQFEAALADVLSAIEDYPGMRFQERVNAALEVLRRTTAS